MAGAVETTANRIAVKPHGMPAGLHRRAFRFQTFPAVIET